MSAASSTIPISCSATPRSNLVCGFIDPDTTRARGGGDGARWLGAELSKIAARYSSAWSSSSSAVVELCDFTSAEASGADRGASNAARSG